MTHRFDITDAPRAYDLVSGDEPSLGILLTYPPANDQPLARRIPIRQDFAATTTAAGQGSAGVSVIGAGNYATAILIPAFKNAGARLRSVVSRAGVSGLHAGRKFGFEETSTDIDATLADPETAAVVIATRHDTHAPLVCRALAARKHVFVEKPLAMTSQQLEDIESALRAADAAGFRPVLTVGFNRRFSPHVIEMKRRLDVTKEPKAFVMTVNAGAIPADHWTQGDAGGGRIIGEACHFIDLLRFLAGVPIKTHSITRMDSRTGDSATVTLTFEDGSVGTILYYANGSKSFPKERLEVFARGAILQLDNFRKLRGFGWPGFKSMKTWRQDKGQAGLARAYLESLETGKPPIPLDELFEVARVTIELSK